MISSMLGRRAAGNSEARKLALSMIDKDGQASGIQWANHEIPKILKTVDVS